jgi:hypothetical protein
VTHRPQPQSLYLIGGAGTGKSTFLASLLETVRPLFGPLEDLHGRANKKAFVTLRGHRVGPDGMYLGRMRESFPGTDGLDRVTSPTAVEWLERGMARELSWIVGEGATLSTRPFLSALATHSNLLVVHLFADSSVKDMRFAERRSEQARTFTEATATRAENLARWLKELGVDVLGVDSADTTEWGAALLDAELHLGEQFFLLNYSRTPELDPPLGRKPE